MLDDKMHRYFKKFESRTFKVRSPKGCHRGMYKHLFESEFSAREIKQAINSKWVEKQKINQNGQHRVVYVWLGQKMLHPGLRGYLQLAWRKVVTFFKGMWG